MAGGGGAGGGGSEPPDWFGTMLSFGQIRMIPMLLSDTQRAKGPMKWKDTVSTVPPTCTHRHACKTKRV